MLGKGFVWITEYSRQLKIGPHRGKVSGQKEPDEEDKQTRNEGSFGVTLQGRNHTRRKHAAQRDR